MHEPTFDHLLLILIYSLLVFTTFVGVLLYRRAYVEMKHTRIIRATWFLLIALLYESTFFGTRAVAMVFFDPLYQIMVTPFWWSIGKIPTLLGVSYFIYASVSPPDDAAKELCRCGTHTRKKRR